MEKKITKYFQQYVQDAINMIQAKNNNISLDEFSNNKIFIIVHVCIQWCTMLRQKWQNIKDATL